jgi:hypothetical protein
MHWIGGCYLITKVDESEQTVSLRLHARDELVSLRGRLGDSARFSVRGSSLHLLPVGPLAPAGEVSDAQLLVRVDAIAADESLVNAEGDFADPLELTFTHDPPLNCGDDHVTAVNLTRPRKLRELSGSQRALIEAAHKDVAEKFKSHDPSAPAFAVEHYLGGPCTPSAVACCVVTGGGGCGWTVVHKGGRKGVAAAIELALSRSVVRCAEQGVIRGGQAVRLHSLQARKDLNGMVGIALRFKGANGRWLVRLADGDGKQLKPSNLLPLDGAGGGGGGEVGCSRGACVMCYWGDAQWSRTQLLGEIARGHWGLCRASVAELVVPPVGRRSGLEGRLVYAPETMMTEDFMRAQMQAARTLNARHGNVAPQDDDDDDEEEGAGLAAAETAAAAAAAASP